MPNLFDKSKSKLFQKKSNLSLVTISSEFFEKIKMLHDINQKMKDDKQIADSLSNDIKNEGRKQWLKLYDQKKENPGSILLECESDIDDSLASAQYCPSDRYISVSKESAMDLIRKYDDNIIEEKTTYTLDNTMVEKYGEIISDLIMNSSDIKDEDKTKLIKLETSFSIKKGSIDRLIDFNDNVSELDEIMEDIKPVVMLKEISIVDNDRFD